MASDTERRIVDNRVFLIGLDELYRSAIKKHERGELLDYARQVTGDLSLAAANVPVEGYYKEDALLTAYFRLMRALQGTPESREREITHGRAYSRLKEVTESPIYGVPQDSPYLIKRARDVLYNALEATTDDPNVEAITSAAYESASTSKEYSLVALGALARDPVVLAALRESVVLYADMVILGVPPEPEYEWQVDQIVEARARHFVETFNNLFAESLPRPCAHNAARFGGACNLERVVGRCVLIATDDSERTIRYYHWAIDRNGLGNLVVNDFWDTSIWTTERYRKKWWQFWR